MAENLTIKKGTKEDQYQSLLPQVKALIEGEEDLIANLANISAALKTQFNFFWVGFYLIKNDELVLGPFQGPVACTRIKKGKGVCGTSWEDNSVLIVADVNQFPGHIACSVDAKSEIVLPVYRDGKIIGVLDIDSDELNSFDDIDNKYISQLLNYLN